MPAISIALKLGCSSENIKEALLDIKVPGRSELVNNKKELTILETSYKELLDNEEALKAEVQELQNPEYLERYAKENK